jgi:two-component system chemotaxis response regulator CheY
MTKQPPTGLGKLHVLVVDDHKGMREIIWTILNGLGVGQIAQAADAATAVKLMRQTRFDAILIDWMLEGRDGLQLARYIRKLPDKQNPFVPIVLVTGYAEYERVVEARDAGVTEFLVKPLTALAVAQRLETIIHHPRSFVRAEGYVGPDRRRRARTIDGPDRRSQPKAALDQKAIDEVIKGGSDEQ